MGDTHTLSFSLLLLLAFVILPAHSQMLLLSSGFQSGSRISSESVCDRQERDALNVQSPEIHWVRVPAKTQSFVLVVDDVTVNNTLAKRVHWMVKNIPADVRSISLDASETNIPEGAIELVNSFNTTAYVAPCPLSEERTYRFRLFAMPTAQTFIPALDSSLLPPPPANSDEIVAVLEKSALYVAVLTGTAYLDPPIPPEVADYHVTSPVGSILNVYIRDEPMCTYKTKELDDTILLRLLSLEQKATIQNSTDVYTLLTYRLINPGVIVIFYDMHCTDLNGPPLRIRLRIGILPSRNPPANVNITTSIVLSRDRPPFKLRQEKYRFIKPSEVLKPSRDHLVLEQEDVGGCLRGNGTDECTSDFQTLAGIDASVISNNTDDGTFDCVAHYSHPGRTTDGSMCQMFVSIPEAFCDASGLNLPEQFGCNSSLQTAHNISIPVAWGNLPEGAMSVVVMFENAGRPDQPPAESSVHWLVTDINAHVHTHIDAGASGTDKMPALSVELPNAFGKSGFASLCGRNDHSVHIWKLRVFAMPHSRTFLRTHNSNKAAQHNISPNKMSVVVDREKEQSVTPVKASVVLQQLRAQALCSATLSVPITITNEQQQNLPLEEDSKTTATTAADKAEEENKVAEENVPEGDGNVQEEEEPSEITATFQFNGEMNVRIATNQSSEPAPGEVVLVANEEM